MTEVDIWGTGMALPARQVLASEVEARAGLGESQLQVSKTRQWTPF